jgi:hypothetical protein
MAMAEVYSARTGLKATEVIDLMDKESYLSGSVAVSKGFADGILSADKITVDEKEKAKAREVNEVRALELQLVNSGMTRSDARSRIQKIKGTPGAAVDPADTPGAVDTKLLGSLTGLLSTLKT